MVTEEFEEWLRKTELPTNVTTREKYMQYLEEELGIHGGSLDVAMQVYDRDLAFQPTGETLLNFHGIFPVELTRWYGKVTLYKILGIPYLRGWNFVQLLREAEEW